MTVFGSFYTRPLTDRTLLCHAILYHFQITLFCGRKNRPFIPLTLFLFSRPLEQLEFIRLSNLRAEPYFGCLWGSCSQPTRPKGFTLPILQRNFQSRYRRLLAHFKPPFQISRARGSLNQLSRFTIHSIQEFHIRSIQSRQECV